jgi:8-oxo-dGTP pyrophosphatase MutT (NUDIX family)
MSASDPPPEPIIQAGVIPFRRRGGRLEFCLITSLKKRRWIFPKGIVEPGETVEQAARKEALEEAGLRGKIKGEPLGTYLHEKSNATLHVTVLLMEVTRCDEDWREARVRQRRWVDAEEAVQLPWKLELRQFAQDAIREIERCGPRQVRRMAS